jgi:hypothetical protein
MQIRSILFATPKVAKGAESKKRKKEKKKNFGKFHFWWEQRRLSCQENIFCFYFSFDLMAFIELP